MFRVEGCGGFRDLGYRVQESSLPGAPCYFGETRM